MFVLAQVTPLGTFDDKTCLQGVMAFEQAMALTKLQMDSRSRGKYGVSAHCHATGHESADSSLGNCFTVAAMVRSDT